jgi:hypothetical protein
VPVAFLVFCRSPPARRGRREEAVTDPPARLDFLRRRVERRAASDGGAWRDAPLVFLRVQKAIPVISDCFGANFCNCKNCLMFFCLVDFL